MCQSEADSGSSLSAINATAVKMIKAGKIVIEHGNQLLDPKSGFSKKRSSSVIVALIVSPSDNTLLCTMPWNEVLKKHFLFMSDV